MAWGRCPLHFPWDPRWGRPPASDLGVSVGPPTLTFLQPRRLVPELKRGSAAPPPSPTDYRH